ncbi:MAG: GH116 family glycosyl hydrolase [Acidobacteriota bacterium]
MREKTCGSGGCCSGENRVAGRAGSRPDARRINRREFMATTAAGGAGLAAAISGVPAVAGPFTQPGGSDHFVPADKKLSAGWTRMLFERGESIWYSGSDLETIGMPIGGICAGQVYLAGDGRLTCWDIFNQNQNTGYGAVNYALGRSADRTVLDGKIVPVRRFEQGFAIRLRAGSETITRTLDRRGFPAVRFCGEYPIGRVHYADPAVPVTIELEAFSPFVPLNAADSAMPATVLRYTVRNVGAAPVEVALGGWLENTVCRHHATSFGERFVRRNEALADGGVTGLVARARAVPVAPKTEDPPRVFADFEGGGYGSWTVEGMAFGGAPAGGTLANQQAVSGFQGGGLVNTFLSGDRTQGRLLSPSFVIGRPFISFLIGGGRHEGSTCINLVIDGRVVRTATGANRERLEPHNWDVRDVAGRMAHIEIVDAESGGWGHINIDQIEFRDSPLVAEPGDLLSWADYGTLCLALAGSGSTHPSIHPDQGPEALFAGAEGPAEKPAGQPLVGGVVHTMALAPGASRDVVFVLAWHMPNMRRAETLVGNRYAGRFEDAEAVARHVVAHLGSLTDQTRLWHRTYYDSTLPHWLLDRVHATVANLATTTTQWWRNGRFWGWEGAGCCHGTCGHVWNYAHAMARLFPELERSVREMQDFAPGVGFVADTGAIAFRGEGWTMWAGDAQGGYILKALREHQMSPDSRFLERNWPRIRKATEFLIDQDANADGLIEGSQHQTYDENYFGANTMVGSLYLGALRAAEEMARVTGDTAFADRCRRIFEAGRQRSMAALFNGEYFIQRVDLNEHPDWQYGDGCLADQLFGQGWAHQVGLGYLYPREAVAAALRSIWTYCWAPDVGPQNRAHDPERWFAFPGEAGLFTCTWPKSRHLGPKSTRYRDEIWTGIEYQVAGHLAWEGMVLEALAICRGVHERYHPSKHNPWNEIECGDHYARALASWGVLVGLAGFEYDGPAQHIGFAPRLGPGDFRCAFTGAEGWGTLLQQRKAAEQENTIAVRWGRLLVRTLAFELPEGATLRDCVVTAGARRLDAAMRQAGRRVVLTLPSAVTAGAGETIRATLHL